MSRRPRLLQFSAAMLLVMTSLVALPANPAGAVPTDRYVAVTGNDTSNDCTSVFIPCRTVWHAITESADGDTIYIGAGTFVENLSTGLDLTFIGTGMDVTILDGGGVGRVMYVDPTATVSMTGMTLQNGNSGSTGGGIGSVGPLTLDQVRVTGNTAISGGGIAAYGNLTVTNSTVSWNVTTSGTGAGIFFNGPSTSSLTNVTVNGNNSPIGAGGLHVQAGAVLNMTNVTVTGNNASTAAAITVTDDSSATILNSTIADNTSTGLYSAISGYGTLSFKNTIVSANAPNNCFHSSAVSWTSLGNNMDSGTTCGFGAGGDQSSTNPQLATLGDYGGPVSTMMLLGTSPAIDTGTNTGCPGTDARGFTRPMNGPAVWLNICDIGAVEVKPETTTIGVYGIAPSPSMIGQDTTVSIIVTGSSTTPTGLVEISSGLLSCSPALDITGFANCGMNFGTPGGRGILYRYMGDGTHDASQAALYHIVNQASRTDFNNDGVADPAKFVPSTGKLWWRTTFSGTWYSTDMGGDVASYVPRSDFDNDGNTDAAKYVSSINSIYYMSSFAGTWQGIYMGTGSYTLLPGSDFDRDGATDPAKYQADGAVWRLLSNTNTWLGTFIGTDAVPALPGSDYDGDGKTDLAKYVAAGAIWYQRSSDSVWDGMYIGSDGAPVPASDFDGDGTTDMAKFLSSSNSLWYRSSSTGVWQGVYLGPGTIEYIPGADFDGDGKTDPAKFDTVGKALWWLKSSTGLWDGSYMGPETYSIAD